MLTTHDVSDDQIRGLGAKIGERASPQDVDLSLMVLAHDLQRDGHHVILVTDDFKMAKATEEHQLASEVCPPSTFFERLSTKKRELFFIPIFGQYLFKSNMVAINRDGGTKAMRDMLQKVQSKLSFGSSIIIFPEGTRKLPGSKPDYKTGFIGIYNHTKRKILPVALNSGLCWPKQSWVLEKGLITIKFLPTIDEGLDKKVLLNEVQDRIETASNLLLDN